jgi:hypothetical protein
MPMWVLPVWDDDEAHKVELTTVKDGLGVGRMLNHDDAQVTAFVSFGAAAPPCYEVLQMWQENPLECLLRNGEMDDRGLVSLCFDWIDVVWHYMKVVPGNTQEMTLSALTYAKRVLDGEVDIDKSTLMSLNEVFEALKPERDALWWGYYEDEDPVERTMDVPHEDAVRASNVIGSVMDLCSSVMTDYIKILSLRSKLMDPNLSNEDEDVLESKIESEQHDLRFGVRNVAHEVIAAEVPYYLAEGNNESFEDIAELRSPLRQRQISDVLKVMKETEKERKRFQDELLATMRGRP